MNQIELWWHRESSFQDTQLVRGGDGVEVRGKVLGTGSTRVYLRGELLPALEFGQILLICFLKLHDR